MLDKFKFEIIDELLNEFNSNLSKSIQRSKALRISCVCGDIIANSFIKNKISETLYV